MTKSECYSQISTCNAGIEEDQKKIREWEEKIDLYENTNRRLERGQENMADFCSCHSRKIRQTRDYFPQVKYVEGYVQDMTEYLQGKPGKIIISLHYRKRHKKQTRVTGQPY